MEAGKTNQEEMMVSKPHEAIIQWCFDQIGSLRLWLTFEIYVVHNEEAKQHSKRAHLWYVVEL